MAYNKTQQTRIDNGQCPQCGNPTTGKVYCAPCRQGMKDKRTKYTEVLTAYMQTHCTICDRETTVLHKWTGKGLICFGRADMCYDKWLAGEYLRAMQDIQAEAANEGFAPLEVEVTKE